MADGQRPNPGLVRRFARFIAGHRRVRRLDGEPIRQEFIEGRHAVSYLRHLVRGNTIPRKRFFENVSDQHPPVLLIHGFLGTRGSMYVLEQRLQQDGFCVVSFNLGLLNVRDIRSSALLIHKKIQSILAQTPVKRIDIVGHSMGGLIGLYYIKHLEGHRRVRRLVMMGSPVRGTWSALLGVATIGLFSSSSWQLLPGSPFLNELHTGALPDDVEYFTIAAERDWLCPLPSTLMEGARGVTVPLGHSSLVVSEEVYRKVLWALRKEDAPR